MIVVNEGKAGDIFALQKIVKLFDIGGVSNFGSFGKFFILKPFIIKAVRFFYCDAFFLVHLFFD